MTIEAGITREEAIEFGKMWLEIQKDSKDSNTYKFFVMAIEALERQPKIGHWINVNNGNPSYTVDGMTNASVKCSECDEWLTASDEYACNGNYCPNCGAKME